MRASSILILLACGVFVAKAEPPPFQELYDVLRTNLVGTDAAALDRAAAAGLLAELKNKVTLVDSGAKPALAPISQSRMYEGEFGYVRVEAVVDGFAGSLSKAVAALESTNRLKGLVIDLRFAGGEHYPSVVAATSLVVAKGQPVLDYGEGLKESEGNEKALRVPVAVLINEQTSHASEALAAALRELGRALLLGKASAGAAYVYKEHRLSSGQQLRLAVAPIKLASGKELPGQGVEPDLKVQVSPEQERLYFKDPFALTEAERQLQGRNSRRMSEADLVRMLREDQEPNFEVEPESESTPARPVVRDPVLARALDVLKGLAVVQQSRSF